MALNKARNSAAVAAARFRLALRSGWRPDPSLIMQGADPATPFDVEQLPAPIVQIISSDHKLRSSQMNLLASSYIS